MLFINLAIAITIVIVCISVFKLNATIGLILSSIYMGLASGLGPVETMATISSGFGNLMGNIGLTVGLGVIIGQLLAASGGARSIARSIIAICPKGKAVYGLGVTAFILAIPVFFDITFVIPLAFALYDETKVPLPYSIGAIAIGAVAAQTFVPPQHQIH